MGLRTLLLLVAFTPLAACAPDVSRDGLVSLEGGPSGSLGTAETAKLLLSVNGSQVATPIGLRLPPTEICYETSQLPCDPELRDAKAVFNVSEAASLFEWMTSIWRKESAEVGVAVFEPSGESRRILHRFALITHLELGSAVRVHWRPLVVKDPGGTRTLLGAAREPVELVVTYPLLKDYPVLRSDMPAIRPQIVETKDPVTRLPSQHYAAIVIDEIKLEIGAAGYDAAEAYARKVIADGTADESEFTDVQVDVVGEKGVAAELRFSAAPVCVRLSQTGNTAIVSLVVRSVQITASGKQATLGPVTVTLKPCRR